MFAHLNTVFIYPAIVLEHSAYFSNIQCVEMGLTLTFTTSEALDYAQNSWENLGDKWLLVSFSKGCSKAKKGERTYWLVEDTKFRQVSLSVEIDCKEIPLDQAIDEIRMDYGHFKPSSSTDTDAGASSSPAAIITLAPSLHPKALARRDWFDGLTDGWGVFTSHVDSDFHDGISWAESIDDDVTSKFGDALSDGSGATKTINIDARPTQNADSPWGQQHQWFGIRDFKAYCVDCALTGHMVVSGHIAFSVSQKKLINSNISMSGDLDAHFGLGFNATDNWLPYRVWRPTWWTQGLPGLSITDIIAIGPYLSLGGQFQWVVMATGHMLTEIDIHWKGFEATLDLDHLNQSTQSGWIPEVTHNVSALGNFSIKAGLGIPMGFNFGIDILPLAPHGNPSAKIQNQPMIELQGEYSNVDSEPCAQGIILDLHFKDSIGVGAFDLPTYPIWTWQAPSIWKQCCPIKEIMGEIRNATAYSRAWATAQLNKMANGTSWITDNGQGSGDSDGGEKGKEKM